MDLNRLLDTILESSTVESPPSVGADTPEVNTTQDNKDALLHLALSNVVHGPESLENDLVSLAQATKDSLKQFLAGKSDIASVDALSGKLQDATNKLSTAVAQVKDTVGNDTLPKDTVKQLRVTGNRFARLKPKTQARLMQQLNVDSFHDDVAAAAKPDKSGKNVAYHVASYALAKPRMKNYRVATEKDRGRGILHLFKKGRKYVGFAVVDRPTTNEDFDDAMELILSEATIDKTVLVYSSDSLADVFNINNYKKEVPHSSEVADHLNGKFGMKLRTLSPAVVNQLKDAPAKEEPAKEQEPASKQAAIVDPAKALSDLADKYEHGSKLVGPDASNVYRLVSEWMRAVKSKADLDHYIKVLHDAEKKMAARVKSLADAGNTEESEKQKTAATRLSSIIKDVSGLVIP